MIGTWSEASSCHQSCRNDSVMELALFHLPYRAPGRPSATLNGGPAYRAGKLNANAVGNEAAGFCPTCKPGETRVASAWERSIAVIVFLHLH
jgi:hypothetical protein